MDESIAKTLLEQYVAGWKAAEIETVLSTLGEDCIITECYGPIYRGRDKVKLWMEKWFRESNQILQWDIHSIVLGQDSAAFEWGFKCLWHDNESFFEGATIARFKDARIQSLREYATTAQLYEWNGMWRE